MEDLALLSQRRSGEGTVASAQNDLPGLAAAREQVDRILASDTLRASDAVRRLLKFLADKALSGEADRLKEYSIGVDALGKPPSFDPRHDASVRLLASRVRLKLDEYYSHEGHNDPVTIEMPRGRFKIVWKTRVPDDPPVTVAPAPIMPGPDRPGSIVTSLLNSAAPPAESRQIKIWRLLAIVLAMICLVLIARGSLTRSPRAFPVRTATPGSSPELEALWGPFLNSRNHLVIAFWNPLFARFHRHGKPDVLYRSSGVNQWDELVKSPEFADLKRILGDPLPAPTLTFTMRGSLETIFTLSQFFARRGDISLDRLDELSWQEAADNDIILVAPADQIMQRQGALPVSPAFVVEKTGIRNLQPLPGEPPMYEDLDDPQQPDGESVELVSMLPGPLGRTRIVSFAGNHAAGLVGSVQSLTDPSFARALLEKLKTSSNEVPPYFQIVVKIRYRDDTPTYTSYVTHRALMLKQN
jgi:hypothetical protein